MICTLYLKLFNVLKHAKQEYLLLKTCIRKKYESTQIQDSVKLWGRRKGNGVKEESTKNSARSEANSSKCQDCLELDGGTHSSVIIFSLFVVVD